MLSLLYGPTLTFVLDMALGQLGKLLEPHFPPHQNGNNRFAMEVYYKEYNTLSMTFQIQSPYSFSSF